MKQMSGIRLRILQGVLMILALVLLYRGVSAILRHKMGRNKQ